MVSILCLCVHNSARSQMAEAILRRQGVQNLHDVALATLESDGYVSVTLKGEPIHGAANHPS